jgi:hypothetical protein
LNPEQLESIIQERYAIDVFYTKNTCLIVVSSSLDDCMTRKPDYDKVKSKVDKIKLREQNKGWKTVKISYGNEKA